uniref:Protein STRICTOSIDINE SYNTHASE-LIKE 5 n=1 Tax=Elaeis guineensis var. tenera TaxID=51953 RepID=A0A6J0PCQ7_ELAGV|nr:protein STRICTOSIDINE SYNTHASE-LIKE 5 [Elaeis guineensis]
MILARHSQASQPQPLHGRAKDPPPPPPPPSALPKPNLTSRFLGLLLLIFVPVLLAAIFFQPPDFDPAPLPSDHSFADSIAVQERHNRVLEASERIGEGLLPGPEDLAYDAEKGYLYTGCSDGWIRRVGLEDGEPKVEDWAYVGGRPLGLALGPSGSLVVAESYKKKMQKISYSRGQKGND